MQSSKGQILRLYRHILKTHRTYLPDRMRILGDEYVKNEWRFNDFLLINELFFRDECIDYQTIQTKKAIDFKFFN
jgi:hypothetical protein